jgi:hypothetical protein
MERSRVSSWSQTTGEVRPHDKNIQQSTGADDVLRQLSRLVRVGVAHHRASALSKMPNGGMLLPKPGLIWRISDQWPRGLDAANLPLCLSQTP